MSKMTFNLQQRILIKLEKKKKKIGNNFFVGYSITEQSKT